jgi:hypothetical protein
VTVTSHASAEPPRASLVVTRDDGSRDCPDASGVAERVREMAGSSMIDAAAREARDTWIQVELTRAFGGYRAVISAQGRRYGTRTIDDVGPGCSSLADAVAITLVMLLDPDLERRLELPPAPLPPPVAAAGVFSRPRRVHQRQVELTEPQPSRLIAGAELAAGLSFAVLDGSAPFAEGGARLQLDHWVSFGAGGGFVFSDRARFGSGSVDLELGYVYLRACGSFSSSSRARLELCLEPMLGSLRGAGNDYTEIHTRSVPWLAAAAVVEIYGPLARSAFWSLRVAALAPVAGGHGFSVVESGVQKSAFEVPSVGGMLSVGMRADL